jgi:hypothetical protein
MRLQEADYKDWLLDIAEGDDAVPPDVLAPSSVSTPDSKAYNDYDESKDPELLRKKGTSGEAISTVVEAAPRADPRLREAERPNSVSGRIKSFCDSSPKDWTFETYQLSDYADPSVNLGRYKSTVKYYIEKGTLVPDDDTRLPDSGVSSSAYGVKTRTSDGNAYGAPPPPKDKTEWSKDAVQFSGAYGDRSIRSDDGTADGIFRSMFNIVRNICLGRAQKRHALIAGDPG